MLIATYSMYVLVKIFGNQEPMIHVGVVIPCDLNNLIGMVVQYVFRMI